MEPSLCFSLRNGVRIVAFIDILIALATSILTGGTLYFFETKQQQVMDLIASAPVEMELFIDLKNMDEMWIRTSLIFSLVFSIFKIYLGFLLFRAGSQESVTKCRRWILWTLAMISFSVLFYMASILAMISLPMSIPVYTILFTVRCYSIWIAGRFLTTVIRGRKCLLDSDANDITTL